MGESIKQGVNRVNISDYRENDYFNSYMVRRDRLDDDGVTLGTYANLNGLSQNILD